MGADEEGTAPDLKTHQAVDALRDHVAPLAGYVPHLLQCHSARDADPAPRRRRAGCEPSEQQNTILPTLPRRAGSVSSRQETRKRNPDSRLSQITARVPAVAGASDVRIRSVNSRQG